MRKHKHTIITLFASLMLASIFAQNAELLTKKITIENSLREKVSFAIEKIIDQSQFVVIVNATLGQNTSSGPVNLITPENTNLTTEPILDADQSNGYSPIPGLPALPQHQEGASSDSQPEQKLPTKIVQNVGENLISNTATTINRVDVTIYLEEAVATAGIIKDIGIIIKEVIPQTAQCSDCIRFETMRFKVQENNENSTIAELVKKIEELESSRLEDERERREEELDMLKVRLKNAEDARTLWEDEARQREINRQRADSLKLANLVAKEQAHQEKRDSLLEVRETEVREVIQERLSTEAKYAERSYDLLEKQLSGSQSTYSNNVSPDSENNGFKGMGMQYPQTRGSSNWLLYLLIGLAIIALAVVSLTKKPKTVYLKPKTKQTDQSPPKPQTQQPATQQRDKFPTTSTANEDEDVLRSELKTARQTAVSMSVGQKESATNIVRNWLEDTAESSENDKESEQNETKEKSK